MDEAPRSYRRLRRRERRLLRRFQLFWPIAFVGLAALLSAGVVRVMEVPRERAPESRPAVARTEPPVRRSGKVPSLTGLDPRPDLSSTLGVGLLDHEIQGPPEESLVRERAPEEEAPLEPEPDLAPVSMGPTRIEPIPEPGTAVLLGLGLTLLGAGRRYSTISRSSTSKVSAAPGGIDDCRGGVSP